MAFYLDLIVPDKQIKPIKTLLEAHNLLDKSVKIYPTALSVPAVETNSESIVAPPCLIQCSLNNEKSSDGAAGLVREDRARIQSHNCTTWFSIPTVFEIDGTNSVVDHAGAFKARQAVLEQIGVLDQTCIGASVSNRRRLTKNDKNPLVLAVREWFELLKVEGVTETLIPITLLEKSTWTYTIYSPMLLLPSNFLSNELWQQLLAEPLQPFLPKLWCIICNKLKVTHIAINKPIPALVPNASTASIEDTSETNILRSPTELAPVHGDFEKANLPPTEENFQHSFWVSTIQNEITQVWAPMYTMFSRGNISEKKRLFELVSPGSHSGVEGSLREPSKSSAVDLYAGIGYFSFSYVKAGVHKVLCWELNGWSIEGMRRGAEENGWTTKVLAETAQGDLTLGHNQDASDSLSERLLIFNESNSNAATRVAMLRHKIPPVRHVNCGYLPSSSNSWNVAVRVLDPKAGGWIHAHENVATHDIDRRRREVVDIFRDLVGQCGTAGPKAYRFNVTCEHVERVKAYAPGITHVVFDIALLPEELESL
ncbi:MAG: hypothetical protein Q9209_004533 [Squamulea sp. 1 TL-2023]